MFNPSPITGHNMYASFVKKPGAIARLIAMSPGEQKIPRTTLGSSTFFREDLPMNIFLRPLFLFS